MTSNVKKTWKERTILKLKNWQMQVKEQLQSATKRQVLKNRLIDFIITVFKYILVIGLCFVILYPLLLQLAIAFRAPTDVNNPTVLWIPGEFSLKNFEVSLIALRYWKALKNSFILAFGVTILQLVSTSLAGYAFARLPFKGSKLLFGLALFTIIVPQTVISLPILRSVTKMGLIGKPITIFLMAGLGMGIKSGIFIYLFRQFYRGIPTELEEAAYVDGANVFQVFYRIMLPNARGAIITVALLAFVWQWNDYYFTTLFISRSNIDFMTLTTQQVSVLYGLQQALTDAGIWGLMGQEITNNPLFSSMILNTSGILVMIPLLVMYFFVQKLFVTGIERSGIVG
ncbi:MAG TPA: carbohydrate ABC transporter permease [Bacilli bacterium]|nr:MAG: L-arabinose transport system permease protein AraQ [Tenericutes bacterium ADurb.BinA124]HNZ50121.1 carbohydrate ABC transporter permease [Bacilli bacterium]HOH18022.1 carbohydrate ABC transporter permease [Bacilli bacterium]HPX83693.1 carbohydrate ABC transporter permease [Bacilli bacterium]HQC74839.1 carbohydrate ABC transporter permease [Bacilli bacterium]